jgi:capsular polysaccharide biosynthesis protein
MPAATGNPGPEVVSFLRSALKRSSSRNKYPRRILVSRSDSHHRKVVNEEELYKKLKPLGFSRVSLTGMTFQEQIDIFSHAEVIMGIHGAGLSNIVFSNPGTKLIEIFPSSYVNSCFRVVALHCKMKYFYLVSERLVRDKNSTLDSIMLSKDEITKLVSSV